MHRVWGLVLPSPVEDWSPGLDSAGDSVSAVRRRQAAGRLGTSEKEQRPSSLTVGDVQKVCVCLYLSCRAISLSLSLSLSLARARALPLSHSFLHSLTQPIEQVFDDATTDRALRQEVAEQRLSGRPARLHAVCGLCFQASALSMIT